MAEGCLSCLKNRNRNAAYGQLYRGFESPPLRHFWPSRMEALFAQLLPRAGVGGRWTSGSNIGVRLLKSCVGSALVKRYRAASAPSTCAVTVPYQRSPMKKTKRSEERRVGKECEETGK